MSLLNSTNKEKRSYNQTGVINHQTIERHIKMRMLLEFLKEHGEASCIDVEDCLNLSASWCRLAFLNLCEVRLTCISRQELRNGGTVPRHYYSVMPYTEQDLDHYLPIDPDAIHPGWYPRSIRTVNGQRVSIGSNSAGNKGIMNGHIRYGISTERTSAPRDPITACLMGSIDGPAPSILTAKEIVQSESLEMEAQ